jgi:hypothetical protein
MIINKSTVDVLYLLSSIYENSTITPNTDEFTIYMRFNCFNRKNDKKIEHIKNIYEKIMKRIDEHYKTFDVPIKKTVNNPDSSRSIMVYEFKIQIKNR